MATKPSKRIKVAIPGVTTKTKVGDLTVGQFIELMAQVDRQRATRTPTPAEMDKTVAEVHRIMENPKSQFNVMRRAIVTRGALLAKPLQRLDAGPSPHVTAKAKGGTVKRKR